MAATLNTQQQEAVERAVASGRFADFDAALDYAVHALDMDDTLASWPASMWQRLVDEGLESERHETAVTESEARAHLASLRTDLNRG